MSGPLMPWIGGSQGQPVDGFTGKPVPGRSREGRDMSPEERRRQEEEDRRWRERQAQGRGHSLEGAGGQPILAEQPVMQPGRTEPHSAGMNAGRVSTALDSAPSGGFEEIETSDLIMRINDEFRLNGESELYKRMAAEGNRRFEQEQAARRRR